MDANRFWQEYGEQWLGLCRSAVRAALAEFGFSWGGFDIYDEADLVHEVQLKFFTYAQQAEVRNPEGLIWAVARSVVCDMADRARYREHEELPELPSDGGVDEEPLILVAGQEEARFLFDRLAPFLPPQDGRVLDYYRQHPELHIEDRNDRERAAAQLAMTRGALRESIRRIRDKAEDLPSALFSRRLDSFFKAPDHRSVAGLLAHASSPADEAEAHSAIAFKLWLQAMIDSRHVTPGGQPPEHLLQPMLHHAQQAWLCAMQTKDAAYLLDAEVELGLALLIEDHCRGKQDSPRSFVHFRRALEWFGQVDLDGYYYVGPNLERIPIPEDAPAQTILGHANCLVLYEVPIAGQSLDEARVACLAKGFHPSVLDDLGKIHGSVSEFS